jgi:hypothetical protein
MNLLLFEVSSSYSETWIALSNLAISTGAKRYCEESIFVARPYATPPSKLQAFR